MMTLFMLLPLRYTRHSQANKKGRRICQFKSTSRRVSSAKSGKNKRDRASTTFGRIELDSHADTIVAGSNCIIMQYTGKECDVSPYRDDYESVTNVPIVHAATAWQSPHSGQTYILVFHEALWMGGHMEHSLVNPNQLRYFGTKVQDDPTSDRALSIINEDNSFCMELAMAGTVVYADTFTPSEQELHDCPHIILSSPHAWDPHKVSFPKAKRSLDEEVGSLRLLSAVNSTGGRDSGLEPYEDELVFSLDRMNRRISGLKVLELVKPSIDPGRSDVPARNAFESTDRHTDVTPQDLSERWGISISTAAKTLKKTTQKFLRSAVLPLSRRYRTDRVFSRKTLRGDWSTDTMDARSKSLEGNRYAQVFANKAYFSRVYPMDSKKKAGDALRMFCQEFGVPERLTFDGSKEQGQPGTEFMKQIRTHDIDHHVSEADLHNQNPVEGVIRELRRKLYRLMVRKRVPREVWDYGLRWISETSSLTYSSAGSIEGSIPITQVTGETGDISEYLDFGFYDQVWWKDNAGVSEFEPGRWLGVSHRTGRLMCYHVLTQRGTVVSRSTVQRVTNIEKTTAEVKDTFHKFDTAIQIKFKSCHEDGYIGDKPNPEHWADLLENDEDFRDEFTRIFDNDDIKEADDITPEALDDTYLKMEVALPRDGEGPELAHVVKRLRDKNGIPIGTANDNPMLDTRIYEVEYLDGHRAALAANTIAENMFAQVDDEGYRTLLLQEIVDHRVNGSEVKKADANIISPNGGRRKRETTKGWEILIQWKDGSTTWEVLKDVKESYPVQIAEYAVLHKISDEPAFAWWVPYVLKKRERIISKVKSKYWKRTHKFGIRVPKTPEEAKRLDQENGNHLWWDAVCQEMKNVDIAFEAYDGDVDDLIGYQFVKCHMIFDVKMGENFRRKARMVAGGHMTEAPSSLTYSSVVSRDSVRIILTMAALNGLSTLASDIQNAYLTAPCREKIWTVAGPEFGSRRGQKMLIVRALYGLKSSGAAFRAFLAEALYDIGYTPSVADPDVWLRPAIKEDGFKYWEYVLCYVDDILAISEKPLNTLKAIQGKNFKFKNDKMEKPENYLGADLSSLDNAEGTECWAMSSDRYCAAMVKNIEDGLNRRGLRLPSKCELPIRHGYKPEMDCTAELKADGLQFYQEMIGSLRWAVEIGRVDILLEVALMSKHLALPREGHLEQVLNIMGYLKSHKKMRLLYDCGYPKVDERWFTDYDWFDFYRDAKEAIPPNMPEARGLGVVVACFVDANHGGNLRDRKSQTGVLIFINKSPIHWYSKSQATVEASTFGAEFCAMKTSVEMIESLRYKLRMFGIPVEGPANVYCDNEAVTKNTQTPESTLKKKHHSIAYHRCREAVAAGTIRIAKQGTKKNLADLFTKVLTAVRRAFLLERFTY